MFKNAKDQATRHRKFIQNVVENETVFALEDKDGCATVDSNKYETETDEPEIVLCYWSDEKTARVCSRKYWPNHELIEIALSDFMEKWCVGMESDGVIAGTNFDWKLFGTEILPLNLLLELFDELQARDKKLTFSQYPSQDAFHQTAKRIKQEYQTSIATE